MMNKINRLIYIVIFSFISLLVFIVDFKIYDFIYTASDNSLIVFFNQFYAAIKPFDVIYVLLWIFILYFYNNIYFNGKKYTKKNVLFTIIAFIFSIITLVCKSYVIDGTMVTVYGSSVQIFKSIIFLIGYSLLYYSVIKKISSVSLNFNNFKKKRNKFLDLINNHPFIMSFILILLMWLPSIIISYPGIPTGDTIDELSQFFHKENTSWTIDTINLLNEDVYINKHHSVFHTVTMGLIYNLGRNLVSFTFGAFLYTVLQVILLLIGFSFMIKYMKKSNIPCLMIVLSILFIGLNPTIYVYAVCAIKDIPFAVFTLLYVIGLLQFVKNFDSMYKNKLFLFLFLIISLLVLLLRNNGIYTFLFSFPCLFFVYKQYWKKILLLLLIPLSIFMVYDKVLLPSFDVSNGSIREVLSIPMMQLARVVHFKTEEFSEEDIKIIDNVLDFKTMKVKYDPNSSDLIKDEFNKDATKEELKDFFGVWFKYFKKHPIMYIEAIVNSTYGYFYPEMNNDELLLYGYSVSDSSFFDINSLDLFRNSRLIFNKLINIYYKLPCFINKVAYYDWILVLSCLYIIIKRKYKYLVPMMPLCSILLVCFASPVNGSFRYILPIIFSLPIILSIDYMVYMDCKNGNG